MGPLDLALHLLSFFAPAMAVAAMVAAGSRLLMPRGSVSLSWWSQAAINLVVGGVVLAAGLWVFGVDGKMLTYTGLVLAVAGSQWLSSRAWRK
jgi:hypothetical protein